MNTPRAITVTPYLTPLPRIATPDATTGLRIRYRWRAELTDADGPICEVNGYQSPDEAIGALIRTAAMSSTTREGVVDFIGSLFGDLDRRSADVQLARAVRFANTSCRRRHPGTSLTIVQPAPADRQAVPATVPLQLRPTFAAAGRKAKKGGAS